jgi:phage gp36-like protein
LYITLQDLVDRLGEKTLIQLTDNARPPANEIDPNVVARAIAFAEGTFNSYARTRYTIPVMVTEKVKAVCSDFAIYHLRRDRSPNSEASEKLRKDLYDPNIRYMEAVQSGKAALDVPAAEETTAKPASPDRILSGSSRPVFTDKKLGGY